MEGKQSICTKVSMPNINDKKVETRNHAKDQTLNQLDEKVEVSHESIVVGGDVKGSYIKENFTSKENGTLLQVEAEIKLKSCKKLMTYAKGKNFDHALDGMINKLITIAEN